MVRKRHIQKKVSPTLQSLMDEVQAEEELKDHKILINPRGEVKMSDVIAELVRPCSENVTSLDEYKDLIALACIAWNTANLPKQKQKKSIRDGLQTLPDLPEDLLQDTSALIMELIKRKKLLFPDNHRMIINFRVTETKEHFNIAIASTLPIEHE